MGGGGSKPNFQPPINTQFPVFLDIEVDTNEDTKHMPTFNFSRGTIVPAEFDGSGNIINHPTAFYIFCTLKIFNYTGENGLIKVPSLPVNSESNPETLYQQFGLTQGNENIFGNTTSYIKKNMFSLTPFSNALTNEINANDTSIPSNSPGLLVPVYCYKTPGTIAKDNKGNLKTVTSFSFFRADVFSPDEIPNKPLQYISPRGLPSFPNPYGKNKDTFYNLCSYYKNNSNDSQQIGAWCMFLTDSQFASFNQNWRNNPVPGKVSIAFNYPQSSPSTYKPVESLNTSQLYTVYAISQTAGNNSGDSTKIQSWYPKSPFDDPNIDFNPTDGWNIYNMGYPLNFAYQMGVSNGFKKMTNTFTYYQDDYINNYTGTVNQFGIPLSYGAANEPWTLNYFSLFFNGDQEFAKLDYFNITNITNNTEKYTLYNCNCWYNSQSNNAYCKGTSSYSNTQIAPKEIVTQVSSIQKNNTGFYNVDGSCTNNTGYYYSTCNSVHTGVFQFAAFQFVPINFFNTPSTGAVPEVYPLGERAYTGKVGPTGLTGNFVAPSSGVPQPLPIGPTGDGNAVITFPFNTDPAASNSFPTPFVGYNIPDSSLITDTIANWYINPSNASVNCPTQTAPDNPYCVYQNYYQALLGKFYIKPTEEPSSLECGEQYAPPAQYWIDQGLTPPTGGCPGTSLCVPNYNYLKKITDLKQQPFICQEPTSTDPYPMSYNGFNYTDPYNITPITWQNMFNYINGVPTAGISSTPQNYKQIGLPPTLQDIVNHDVNPVTNVTQKESETTLPFFLVLAIIGIIAFVCVIIYIIYKGNKSKEKDVYNPMTEANYRRVY